MEIANYNSIKDSLSGSIKDQNPQLYDEVNDKAVYAKGLVETTGNLMTTGAVVGTIKKLKGSASIMEKLGLSQEDLEGMAEEINNGNGQDVLAGLSKRIINKGTNKLQGAFNKLLGRSTEPDAPEPPVTEPSAPVTGTAPPSDLDLISNEEAQTLFNPEVNVAAQEATTANQSIVGSVGVASRQESIDQASAAATRAATLGSNPSSVAANVVKTNVVNSTEDEVAEGGAKIMSKAVKAEDVLKGLTEGSEVADENPIGLAVTAALGVASLVGGLFIHTHHNSYATANVIGVKSYAANLGIDY